RRRHTRFSRDWSSDVCSSDLFLRQYSASSVSFIANVSITTKNLSWLLHLSLVCPLPGVATPAARASLRHLYKVTSVIPCSSAICATDSLFGGIILLMMESFSSFEYRTPFFLCISTDLRVIS